MSQSLIVDSHHHFWDPARAEYPWMTSDLAAIRRRFEPSDMRPLLQANGVDKTVLVQTRSSFEETIEFMETAAATDFVAGVVGWVDLTKPDVGDDLAKLKARPDGKYLVGIRHQVHDEPDPDWFTRSDVQRGVAAVGAAGLVYDLLSRTRELPACLATVRTLPGTRFVIDHIAKPPIAAGKIDEWAAAMAPFADLPNVWCKLSGLVTEANWQAWTRDDLQPYVDRVMGWFGEDRVLFGSDWPVSLLAAPYDRVKGVLEELLEPLSDAARAEIFGGNAIEVYRLPLD